MKWFHNIVRPLWIHAHNIWNKFVQAPLFNRWSMVSGLRWFLSLCYNSHEFDGHRVYQFVIDWLTDWLIAVPCGGVIKNYPRGNLRWNSLKSSTIQCISSDRINNISVQKPRSVPLFGSFPFQFLLGYWLHRFFLIFFCFFRELHGTCFSYSSLYYTICFIFISVSLSSREKSTFPIILLRY